MAEAAAPLDEELGSVPPAGQIALLKARYDGLEKELTCKQEVINFHNWQIDVLKAEAGNLRNIVKQQEAVRLYVVASAQEGFPNSLGSLLQNSNVATADQSFQEPAPAQPVAPAAIQQNPYNPTVSGNGAKRKRSPGDDASSQ